MTLSKYLVVLFLILGESVWADYLFHKAQNFSNDYSGNPADTSGIGNFGNTLSIGIQQRVLREGLAPTVLNNLGSFNGRHGANPVVTATGGRNFKIAYIIWETAQVSHPGPIGTMIPTQASITSREVYVSDSNVVLSETGNLIVRTENIQDNAGIFYGGGLDRRPPPAYLNFAASGSNYAAYWTTLQIEGSLRRTSNIDSAGRLNPTNYGIYVPNGTPDKLGYLGQLGMKEIPGTNGLSVILAYDKSISPASGTVRWDNIAGGTTHTATISRPGVSLMEDFAVGADPSGNSLILWREGSKLFGIGYTADRNVSFPVTQLVSSNIYTVTSLEHTYRPYAVEALGNSLFVIVYGKSFQLYYRTVNTSTGILGPETELTTAAQNCIFPDADVSGSKIIFTWYGNSSGGSRRVEAALFDHAGGVIDVSTRKNFQITNFDVGFNVGDGWKPYHNFRVPHVALNATGDFVVTYDNQFGAEVASWANLPLYFDTAQFISKPIPFMNPFTNQMADSLLDTVRVLEVYRDNNSLASFDLSFSNRTDFSGSSFQRISQIGKLSSPIQTTGRYLRYRLLLNPQSSKTKTTTVDSVQFFYNFKPRLPQILQLNLDHSGGLVNFQSDSIYSLWARYDSLQVIAEGQDIDRSGLRFIYQGPFGTKIDTSTNLQAPHHYRSTLKIPPASNKTNSYTVSLKTIDSLNWESSSTQLLLKYRNDPPSLSGDLVRRNLPLTGVFQNKALAKDSHYVAWARDTLFYQFQIADINDDSVNVSILLGSTTMHQQKHPVGKLLRIPLFGLTKMDTTSVKIRLSDPDTTTELSFTMEFFNDPPEATLSVRRDKNPRLNQYQDTLLVSGDTLSLWARDSFFLVLKSKDPNDTSHALSLTQDGIKIWDSTKTIYQDKILGLIQPKGYQLRKITLAIRDRDTLVTHDFFLKFLNDTPRIQTVLFKNKGQDLNGRFRPASGGVDTLYPPPDTLVHFHVLDSSRIVFTVADSLDDTLQLYISAGSDTLVQKKIIHGGTHSLILPGNSTQENYLLKVWVVDPDTLARFQMDISINAWPKFEKIISNQEDLVLSTITQFNQTPQVKIIPFKENQIKVTTQYAEGQSLWWGILKRPSTCDFGQLRCYTLDSLGILTQLTRSFTLGEEKLVVRSTDTLGAFLQDTFDLVFPYMDTLAGAIPLNNQIRNLLDTTDLIIGSKLTRLIDTVEIFNTGSGLLSFSSISTKKNAEKWMNYLLIYNSLEGPKRQVIGKNTQIHPLFGSLDILPTGSLKIRIELFVDSLKGDGTVYDTLILLSNDYFQPVLKIPFELGYKDLPTVKVSMVSRSLSLFKALKQSGGVTQIPKNLELQSSLLFKFSEPILNSTIDSNSVRIYSLRDSLKTGASNSISSYFPAYFYRYFSFSPSRQLDTTRVDSLLFSPMYRDSSSYFKLLPPPGNFLPNDRIQVRISNSLTDTAGNALDLAIQKIASAPGTEDSTLSYQVRPDIFEVVKTDPLPETSNYNPERPIKIWFNDSLALNYTLRNQYITSIDTGINLDSTNAGIRITSTLNNQRSYQFYYVRLTNGDSAIEFLPKPKIYSGDSVTVTLFSSIGNGRGLSLDGNSDSTGNFIYNSLDTADRYTLKFTAHRSDFYIYPNPFRWSDNQHAELGYVTFKNFNQLPGVKNGDRLHFKIYNMNAELIFSSEQQGREGGFVIDPYTPPVYPWNLRNQFGHKVATGVYIYSVFKKDELLKKGKLAVLR